MLITFTVLYPVKQQGGDTGPTLLFPGGKLLDTPGTPNPLEVPPVGPTLLLPGGKLLDTPGASKTLAVPLLPVAFPK